MSNSKIPSPARSQGAISTPRRHRFGRSYSVGSPTCSNTTKKLSYIVEEYKMLPFVSSPQRTRRSVLSDNTYIDAPGRQSWYKRLDDNTGDVIEVLERREQVENVEEYINPEILSQEKKNFTIDLPESSDGESISSIVIPQRKLFSLKDNLQAQKLFNNVMENRENFSIRKSKCNNDKTIIVGKKELFNRGTKERSKSIFTANMENGAVDSTLPNKAKETENQEKVRNLFGIRVTSKRKNMFAEFIVSESEDEIPDIQPKVSRFPSSNEEKQPETKNSRLSTLQRVQNTSVGSCISYDEIDDWKLLPSSTMVENEFGITIEGTPVKRVRLSERNKASTLPEDTGINEVNKTKQSIITVTDSLRSKFTNEKQIPRNKSKNKSFPSNEISLNKKRTSNELEKMEVSQNVQNEKTTATSQNSDYDSNKDSSAGNNENDFTLQYENDQENLGDNTLDENNVTLQRCEDGNSSPGCINTGTKNTTNIKSNSLNNTLETNLIKYNNLSLNENSEMEKPISKVHNKTLSRVNLTENNESPKSFHMKNQDNNTNSSNVLVVEQENHFATNVQQINLGDINEKSHTSLAVNLPQNHEEEPENLDIVEENNRKRNCSSQNLGNDSIKNISNNLMRDCVNVDKYRENGIDDNIMTQGNEEFEINQNEKENSYKTTSRNINHDEDDKSDENIMGLEGNHRTVDNSKDNVEENVDSYVNENSNQSVDEETEENNEENDENNESSKNVTEPKEHQEEDEIIDPETDTEHQEDDVESEGDDKSEEDNISDSNTIFGAEQEEENEMNSTEIEQDYYLENEEHVEEVDSEGYHESDEENPKNDVEDGEKNENQHESYENDDTRNTTTEDQRISHISSIREQSTSTLHGDLTVDLNHDTSRTERQTALKMYLMDMKKANIEKKRQTEVAVRNSIKASAPLREYNLFKVPAKPKPSRRPQIRALQAKPKVKHLSTLDNLPPELLEDLQYKPPRRYQPNNASWITKRLYKYLEDKLEPKYDYKARVRAEKLVETINNFARELRRHSVAPPDAVTLLKAEMARLGVTKTHYDFYEFFHEFMPREIRVKVVPDIVNKISLPEHGIFSDILS